MAMAREEVGAEELLSRFVFNTPMFQGGAILAKLLFEFPDNKCESVVWHRYVADGLDGIHRMGCEKQLQARAKQKAAGKIPDKTYIGAATARAGQISIYRNPNGHGVKVVHEPREGRHHVHICYDSPAGAPHMTPSDKSEIKLKLAEIFHDLSRHDCPE
jgi:hypothetical protein